MRSIAAEHLSSSTLAQIRLRFRPATLALRIPCRIDYLDDRILRREPVFSIQGLVSPWNSPRSRLNIDRTNQFRVYLAPLVRFVADMPKSNLTEFADRVTLSCGNHKSSA